MFMYGVELLKHTDVELVQESFSWIYGDKDTLADSFYERLFEREPKIKMLFTSDHKKQKQMLVSVMAMIVKGLDDPDKLRTSLMILGEQHTKLGVRAEYYEIFGDAFIETILRSIGGGQPPELEAAWCNVFGNLVDTMRTPTKNARPTLN